MNLAPQSSFSDLPIILVFLDKVKKVFTCPPHYSELILKIEKYLFEEMQNSSGEHCEKLYYYSKNSNAKVLLEIRD